MKIMNVLSRGIASSHARNLRYTILYRCPVCVRSMLDIGHARNNAPFSSKYTLGKWYALVGKETVGYHLHQVVLSDGIMKNHYPIMDVYGPLISLSSFFWGWQTGSLCHAPMYLEIRSDNIEDTFDSLQYIRQYVMGEFLSSE